MSRNANAQFFWDTLYDHDIENDDHNNGVDYVDIDKLGSMVNNAMPMMLRIGNTMRDPESRIEKAP